MIFIKIDMKNKMIEIKTKKIEWKTKWKLKLKSIENGN